MAKYSIVSEHIDGNTRAQWDRRRWNDDGVDALAQGFTLIKRGRDGSIYYREENLILELPYEISGTPAQDILVSTAGFSHWVLPMNLQVEADKQMTIRHSFENWLLSQHIRALLD
jgi:hypothetical protein